MINVMPNANKPITVPSLAPKQLISVNINIPYLDMIYERVSPYISNELLSIGLSIAVYRLMWDTTSEEGSEERIDRDGYEEMYINEFVVRAVDFEKETYDRPNDLDIVTKSEYQYYANIVRDLILHIEKYFISDCSVANITQLEFLMGVMETKEFIDVIRHTYDHPSGYLYIFLDS